MRDELDHRLWVEHGAAFSRDVDDLFARIGRGFDRLQQLRFAAPWRAGGARGPGQA